MNVKAILAASAITAFACLSATIGCGGDDCTKASDHLTECLRGAATDDTTNTASASIVCSGTPQCVAIAVNTASCDELKDAYSPKPTKISKNFSDAIDKCAATGSL